MFMFFAQGPLFLCFEVEFGAPEMRRAIWIQFGLGWIATLIQLRSISARNREALSRTISETPLSGKE
jgi:hypothetical protein